MSHHDTLDTDILTYLERHENKDLLRFVAVGSVDDGKSTLIGRLLHDTKSVYDDQLDDARSSSADGQVDLARITDGLRAEREQGITIDVAYRYFTTARRKFIIADTPGHIQYTRNMATGASTADVAITLIDARHGVLQQSRRHAYIASLLGISRLVVAVNKMDLVDFNRERYDEICADFRTFGDPLGFKEIRFFPVSALDGDNVVTTSERTPWYTEGSMLEYLETVEVREQPHALPFRFPVQYVIRPHLDYRGFAGQVSSGIVRPGDDILVLPSMKRSKVRSIDTYDGEMAEAYYPTGVVIRLEDEIDISRGDMLVHADAAPSVERHFEAMVVWMADQPLDVRKSYLIKHCSRYVRTDVRKVDFKVNLDTMAQEKAVNLQLNDIGLVKFTAHRPIFADPYAENRQTGAFVVIDTMTNNTVGAGMILRTTSAPDDGQDIRSTVGAHDRATLAGALSMTAWIQGGPADTLAAVAYRVEQRLFEQGILATVVEAKDENVARDGALALDQLVEVSARLNDAGVIVLAAVAESSRHDRNEARLRVGDSRWREITIGGDSEVDDAVEEVLNHLRQTGRVQ